MWPLLSLYALCLARVCFSTQPPLFPLLPASVVAAADRTLHTLLLGGVVGAASGTFGALLRATVRHQVAPNIYSQDLVIRVLCSG